MRIELISVGTGIQLSYLIELRVRLKLGRAKVQNILSFS